MAAHSAGDRKVVDSDPASASIFKFETSNCNLWNESQKVDK